MSGMGDGYVGTAQDAVRIRRLEKQREAERQKIQELKTKSASDKGQPGLLQFGSSTSEILETAFKKETVGLVTREQYVEKRVNIRNKIEEEEKEKLQKLQQEEEELQLQKRKKRKIKGNSRLSFADDLEDGSEEEDEDNKSFGSARFQNSQLGKDPTVETSFLPDRVVEDDVTVSERLRNKLSVKGCGNTASMSLLLTRLGAKVDRFFTLMCMRMCEQLLMQLLRKMSLMLGRLWKGIGTKRTSIFSLLQDGRYMIQQRNGSVTPSTGTDFSINSAATTFCSMRNLPSWE